VISQSNVPESRYVVGWKAKRIILYSTNTLY
jgi:hypothetical protein